jgi:tetratricopeptide (TPR) repeat protein
MKQNCLILCLLVMVTCSIPLGTGLAHLSSAASTSDNRQRAFHLEQAARLIPWQPDLYEQAGMAYQASQQRDRAILLFNLARQHGTLSPLGKFELGKAYQNSGDNGNSIRTWEELLEEGQLIGQAAPLLAEAYQAQGDTANEERILRRWLNFDPLDTQANQRLGLLLSPDSPAEALPLLEQAAASKPITADHLQGLINALKNTTAPPAYRLTLTGQALVSLSEWKLARTALTSALQADPTYAPAWAWLAITDLRTNSPGAEQKFTQALALQDNSAPIHSLYGIYLEAENRLPEAETQYQLATRLEPENYAWWLALARVLSRRDLAAALETYRHAVDLDPQKAETWYSLAAFCVENEAFLQEYGLEAALRTYALDPQNPHYMDLLGRALAASGEAESAEAMFRQAIAAAPQQAGAKFHLALLYLQNGRMTESKTLLEETLHIDGDGPYGVQAESLLARYFP